MKKQRAIWKISSLSLRHVSRSNVMVYDFLKIPCFRWKKTLENHDVTKTTIPNHFFFRNFASVNYVLFATASENLARLQSSVSELWRREKVELWRWTPWSRDAKEKEASSGHHVTTPATRRRQTSNSKGAPAPSAPSKVGSSLAPCLIITTWCDSSPLPTVTNHSHATCSHVASCPFPHKKTFRFCPWSRAQS